MNDALLTIEENSVQEQFFERGWSDGLPVVAPTPERVEQMVGDLSEAAQAVLGSIPQRGRMITLRDLGVAAVMAGCRADYMPVLTAGVAALLDPGFNAHGVLSSTGGAGLTLVVSGEIAAASGMSGGSAMLGPSNRANLTLGRALRLLAWNALDARPDALDATSIGHPGRISCCFAEADAAGWEPIRVALGYEPQDTAVVLMATEGPRQVANHASQSGEAVLRTLATALANPSTFICGRGGQALIALGPEHHAALTADGISRTDAASYLVAHSRVSPEAMERAGIDREADAALAAELDADGLLPTPASVDDLLLVRAGGPGSGWSALIPSFAPTLTTRFSSRRVRPAGEPLPDCGPDSCTIDPAALRLGEGARQ